MRGVIYLLTVWVLVSFEGRVYAVENRHLLELFLRNSSYRFQEISQKKETENTWGFSYDFIHEGNYYSNADYRRYQSGASNFLRNDDNHYYAASSWFLRFYSQPDSRIRVNAGFSYNFLWAFQSNPEASLNELSFTWNAGSSFIIKAGRFYFRLHETPREILFADTINGLLFEFTLFHKIDIRFIGVDFINVNLPSNSSQMNFKSQNTDANFNGDSNHIRSGFTLSIPFRYWALNIFSFLVRYAGAPGGTDRAWRGSNIPDGDFVYFFGARQSFRQKKIQVTLLEASSYGIDRKVYGFTGNKNAMDTNGYLLSLESSFEISSNPLWKAGLTLLMTSPHRINDTQDAVSAGFTSTVSDPVGGILAGRYKNYHAGASACSGGINFSIAEPHRSAGIYYIEEYLETKLETFQIRWSNYVLHDTSGRPPLLIGFETNLLIFYRVIPNFTLYLAAGVFLPGEYQHKIPVDGFSGKTPFSGVLFGSFIHF